MNDFNKRYDFDRTQRPKWDGSRLRAILILLAVLAVTGAIIYFIIPHGEQKTKKPTAPQTGTKTPQTPPEAAAPQNNDAAGNDSATPGAAGTADKGKVGGSSEAAASPGNGTTWSSGTPTEGGVNDPMERAREIVVQPGEDLGTIAKRHHTTVEGIKHINGLKDDRIINGQKLKVIPGPWRITVQNGLALEHQWEGKWQLFKTFPADANGTSGKFVISSRHYHPIWIDAHGGQFKYGSPENPYGDYLLKLANPKTPDRPLRGYGIHGVDDKAAAPMKNCGRGCIHVRASDIEQLYYLVCPGTEVTVTPGGTVPKPESDK